MIYNIRDYFLYDYSLNKVASYPIANTALGAARIAISAVSLLSNLPRIVTNFEIAYTNIRVDLHSMGRGFVELIPIIGGVFGSNILTPAQKVAFRIQELAKKAELQKEIVTSFPLVDVPTLPDHPELQDFLNGCKVKMSQDDHKINTFLSAFKAARVDDPIFSDKELPYFAMSAFVRKEIDREDMATLMHYYVAKRTYPDCKLLRLMDDSTETRDLLQAIVKQEPQGLVSALTTDQLKRLAQKLAILPPHKLIFWTHEALVDSESRGIKKSWQGFEQLLSPVGSLCASLVYIQSVLAYNEKEYTFSFNADRMILNAKYGRGEKNFCRPKLGLFNAKEIKAGVEDGVRLCATYYPGAPFLTNVHNSEELAGTITKHDRIHAHILQSYPDELLKVAKNVRAEFAAFTGFEMSKEIWDFTELVIVSYLKNPSNPNPYIINYLRYALDIIKSDREGPPMELQWRELFWMNENGREIPTVLCCYLDLKLKGGSTWQKLSEHSLKQEVWHIQQQSRGIKELPPEDHKLAFRKVKSGRRKNTIELVRIS